MTRLLRDWARKPETSMKPARTGVCLLVLGLVTATGVLAASPQLHRPFTEALAAHVSRGVVNYSGLATDRNFAEYLERLAQTDAARLANEKERLVYWINAYNAFAIKGILDGGSPSSFFGRIGFFSGATYDAGGKRINLYDLEHEILRRMNEPRFHFAIVCASTSCPSLRSEAYVVEKLEAQLESDARAFVNDPRKNRFDRESKVAYLSKIFDWFEVDFEKHSGSVLAYVAQYVEDMNLAAELRQGRYSVKYLPYDWSLNGTPVTS